MTNTMRLRRIALVLSLGGLSSSIVEAQESASAPQRTFESSVSTTMTSTTTSSSLLRDYENDLMLGVFPAAPIASLTMRVQAEPDYGEDDAYCVFYGPGSEQVAYHGEKTFEFSSLPGQELDRSQAMLNCSYYTHEPHGPLWWEDFFLDKLEARDKDGQLVPTSICVFEFDYDALPIPAPDGCRYACGDAICDGGEPEASDALAVLRRALDLYPCWSSVCDVDRSGKVTAIDALRVLRRSAGLPEALLCLPQNCL